MAAETVKVYFDVSKEKFTQEIYPEVNVSYSTYLHFSWMRLKVKTGLYL